MEMFISWFIEIGKNDDFQKAGISSSSWSPRFISFHVAVGFSGVPHTTKRYRNSDGTFQWHLTRQPSFACCFSQVNHL